MAVSRTAKIRQLLKATEVAGEKRSDFVHEKSRAFLQSLVEHANALNRESCSLDLLVEMVRKVKSGTKLAKAIESTNAFLEKVNFPENKEILENSVGEAIELDFDNCLAEELDRRETALKQARKEIKEKDNRYRRIIEHIFFARYTPGASELVFERQEIEAAGRQFLIKLPKNLGDVVYSFRYRNSMPQSIREKASPGSVWIIRGAGRARYCFVELAESAAFIHPTEGFAETKVPDATPGIIAKYALSDEQALLAKLRYNRLIDIFTGVACYSLQNHLRTTVPDIGQIETDEIYVGVDRKGAHYVIPVQAKRRNDVLSIVQIEQDFGLCEKKFPRLVCRPIAAQFKGEDLIVLIDFEINAGRIARVSEKHYRLVPHAEITPEDLESYFGRPP